VQKNYIIMKNQR